MKFFLSILIFISVQSYGQSWFHKGTVDWYGSSAVVNSASGIPHLQFRNALFNEDNSGLAFYTDRIKWDHDSREITLSFFRTEAELINISDYTVNVDDEELEIHYEFSIESGQTYLQFWFIPLIIDSKRGVYEKINSFILKIESELEQEVRIDTKKTTELYDSPLVSGEWFKIRLSQSGIHKLKYSDLQEIGLSNPKNVRIYGYGGEALPENALLGTQDELYAIPVFMEKGSDGSFNSGDYILFYANGPETWSYNSSEALYKFSKNVFTDYAYYFITSDKGEPIFPVVENAAEGSAEYISNSYDILVAHELDEVNHLQSGKEWFGESFDLSTIRNIEFELPALKLDQDVIMQTRLLSRGHDTTHFIISVNGELLDSALIRQTSFSDYTSTFAYTSQKTYNFNPTTENLIVKLQYIKSEATDAGWLDYLVLNGRADLTLIDDELEFSDKNSFTYAGVKEFVLQNTNSSTKIWNISNANSIMEIDAVNSGGSIRFKTDSIGLQTYIAFNKDGQFPVPQISGDKVGKIENQNLHNSGHPDLVIISHPDFMESAEKLASFRRSNNNLQVIVTQPEIIYNEFSSGRPDVTAIRNYMRYLYNQAGGTTNLMPQYLLLFGDGSYNFKANGEEGNFVPTYQSDNSLSPIYSYVSDDYYGLLDDGESMYSGLLDIGIGRLPINSSYEAEQMVTKIMEYEAPDKMGDWRNTICFIGDDEDYNIHFSQAYELANYVEDNYSSFNVRKIFLDAYQQISTSKGERYPDVNLAINEQVNKGALIVNYTGHGGTKGLAHEQILGLNDIDSWENEGKLPLFMTATCEFSRFDDPDFVSAGEKVIMNEKGGGIALLTTTRLVYSGPNHVMNERFYEIVFEKTAEGLNYCLGDIMKYSKNNAGSGINKRNFTLLGDPAMRLSYPTQTIKTDSINSSFIASSADTLRALKEVVISGHVENSNEEIIEDFNGLVFPVIYDKETMLSTLGNDGGTTKTFTNRDKIIYKGKATIKDGYFSFSFIIPKDINYSFGKGRISYYAQDSLRDAAGAYNDIIIGGSESDVEEDLFGPEISVFMNNDNFISGGITDENPVLYIEVFDEHGINTTGNGIGHDILGSLDNNSQLNWVLNDYYQSDLDSYKSGSIEYPLFNIEEGKHSVNVKIWDIYNNSSEATVDFVVIKDEEFLITNLLNFPNPFFEYTEISFDHNMANIDMEIRLDIFDMGGKLLKTIETNEINSGFRSNPINWDGHNENGSLIGKGIYLYRIRVKTSEGSEAENTGKMIILH